MKRTLILILFVLAAFAAQAQTLYVKTFGNSKNVPIIFIHGGPSSSCVYFEATTAQKLADEGFYVIAYDRRGEGRSVDKNAKMNFEEAFEDLNSLYKKYHLKKATLIGFSFGGLVTTLYAEKYPEKIRSIILTSALISQQESYNTILRTTKAIYQKQGDTAKLNQLAVIEKMDKNSVAYRDSTFKHASQNGYFKLAHPDAEAQAIYDTYNTDPLITQYVKNEESVHIFWNNETRKNIDISPVLKSLKDKGIPIYALYGKQDGLYSLEQIDNLSNLLGKDHLRYLNNCSHTVFIDQQAAFLSALKEWELR